MYDPNEAVIQAAHQAAQGANYDEVTVVLTALGVIIAALGVIFAISSVVLGAFAIIGYRDFKQIMTEQNERMMRDILSKYPTPQQLRDDLFSQVTGVGTAPIPVIETSNTDVQSTQQDERPLIDEVSPPYPGEGQG